MTNRQLPPWAVRLREERVRRLWSQKVIAVRMRDAADEQTRAALPSIESIQRYVRGYEAGQHAPGDLYAELYCRVFGLPRAALFGDLPGGSQAAAGTEELPTAEDARNLAAWITATNVSDEGVSNLVSRVFDLAEAHATYPPAPLLAQVSVLHHQVQGLLHGGRQRPRQARELYRLDADLLAHASLLLGDMHRHDAAAAHGATAQLCADEAGTSPAVALSVQAKTERWRMRFASSADLARQGYDCSPATPIRILLASQEANAAALMGDLHRARAALRRAERASETVRPDSGISAWSCPPPRQALFALSVAIRAQDASSALAQARTADAAWASGAARRTGTWAQVRLGAAIARIMTADLDGALAEIAPVMSLAPEFRMATITGYTRQIDQRLRQRRFLHDGTAMAIRVQIQDFHTAALGAPGLGNV